MRYLVKLMVYRKDDPAMEGRVREAIRKSGARIRGSECTKTSRDSREECLTVVIDETRALSRVVRAVEDVRGAAVISVSEPKALRA
jgi:hypothetical protein